METSPTQPLGRPNEHSIGTPGRFFAFLESPFFWLLFVAVAFGMPLARGFMKTRPEPLPVLGTLPPFQLRNQDNQVVTADLLKGSVLVVDFIFTTCPDVCPLLTAQMQKIQQRVRSAGTDIRLVSISVDPESDTPEVLKAYGKKYDANFSQWWFLTGPLDAIAKVVVDGFKVTLEQQKNGTKPSLMEITHGENFVIVDQLNQIRAYTHADNNAQIDDIVRKVAMLANTRPPSPKAR